MSRCSLRRWRYRPAARHYIGHGGLAVRADLQRELDHYAVRVDTRELHSDRPGDCLRDGHYSTLQLPARSWTKILTCLVLSPGLAVSRSTPWISVVTTLPDSSAMPVA